MDAPLPGLPPIPFLGRNGGAMRFFSDPVGVLHRLAALGEVAAVQAGDRSFVVAFGEAANREVLSDPALFHNYGRVPFPVPEGSSMERLMNALTSMNGERHRSQRRLLMPAFTRSAVEAHRDTVVELTGEMLATWAPGREIDIAGEMDTLAVRIAMRCLFGVEDHAEADELSRLGLALITGLTDPRNMVFPVPWGPTPLARLLRVAEALERLLRVRIARTREALAAGEARRDVLALLVNAHDEDGTRLTDDELVGQANVLFIAGHETTSFTLAWTLFLLAEHPDVAAWLDEELAGLAGPPVVADLPRLTRLDAVLKESQRLLPATPFLFIREPTESASVLGRPLPKGAWLVLSPLLTHRDPVRFPDPLAFRPTRWAGKDPGPFAYLPFGAGARMCIGAGFAAQNLRLILPMILRHARLALPSAGVKVDIRTQGVTMGPAPGIPARVVARSEARPPAVPVRGRVRELVALP